MNPVMEVINALPVQIPRKRVIQGGIIFAVVSGFLFCSYSGGFLGIWASCVAYIGGFGTCAFLLPPSSIMTDGKKNLIASEKEVMRGGQANKKTEVIA